MLNFKKKLKITLTLPFLSLLTLLSCKDWLNTSSSPKNLILIIIDSLRADHLGSYGYSHNTSPEIDKIAKEGILFENALSTAPWTSESVPSILTGTYSGEHKLTFWNQRMLSKSKTFFEYLKEKGAKTFFSSDFPEMKILDIKKRFDETRFFTDPKPFEMIDEINKWLDQNKKKSFAIYLHFRGTHFVYNPPPPYNTEFLQKKLLFENKDLPVNQAAMKGNFLSNTIPAFAEIKGNHDPNFYISQYDGLLKYTDKQIGLLKAQLEKLSLLNNTLLIITADHGEMLGEKEFFFTHTTCYEKNIRVPLIIRFPIIFKNGTKIDTTVSHLDLFPTILEIFKIKIPTTLEGESLLAFFTPGKSYHLKNNFIYAEGEPKAVRANGWKLLSKKEKPFWELYNLNIDPLEKVNLFKHENELANKLRNLIFLERIRVAKLMKNQNGSLPFVLTEDEKSMLKSLGYIQ